MAPKTNFQGNIIIINCHLGMYNKIINSGSEQGEVCKLTTLQGKSITLSQN